MNNKTNDTYSLSHTTWKCQYHIVFVPKYRIKVIYPNCNNKLSIFVLEPFGFSSGGSRRRPEEENPAAARVILQRRSNPFHRSFLTRSNTEITESADLSGKRTTNKSLVFRSISVKRTLSPPDLLPITRSVSQ